jgi:hypothetical protein
MVAQSYSDKMKCIAILPDRQSIRGMVNPSAKSDTKKQAIEQAKAGEGCRAGEDGQQASGPAFRATPTADREGLRRSRRGGSRLT